ncbi:hypothetical protein GCM10023238_00920 [Streptomyces heliomycini]
MARGLRTGALTAALRAPARRLPRTGKGPGPRLLRRMHRAAASKAYGPRTATGTSPSTAAPLHLMRRADGTW